MASNFTRQKYSGWVSISAAWNLIIRLQIVATATIVGIKKNAMVISLNAWQHKLTKLPLGWIMGVLCPSLKCWIGPNSGHRTVSHLHLCQYGNSYTLTAQLNAHWSKKETFQEQWIRPQIYCGERRNNKYCCPFGPSSSVQNSGICSLMSVWMRNQWYKPSIVFEYSFVNKPGYIKSCFPEHSGSKQQAVSLLKMSPFCHSSKLCV